MLPNQKFRKKFSNVEVKCINWAKCGCPTLCSERAQNDEKYCIRADISVTSIERYTNGRSEDPRGGKRRR